MRKAFLFFMAALLGGSYAIAAPFRFDEASVDVQDYVVIGVTNAIRHATVALVKWSGKNQMDEQDSLISYFFCEEMGLKEIRCREVLKGDESSGGGKNCYLYETSRYAHELPRVWSTSRGVSGTGQEGEGYFKDDKIDVRNWVWLRGRDRWMYYPPYDPYLASQDADVQLMLLTPEHRINKSRIKLNGYSTKEWTIQTIIGKDYKNQTSEELMAKLGVEKAFSNRVFRLNEGCAFHVDYPVANEDTEALPEGSSALMHLSAEEVSELVYLAYLVDGDDAKGYAAAVLRCPKILKPVSEIKTTFGKRLQQALEAGGMLVQGGSVAVQQSEITETTLKSFFYSIVSAETNVVFTFNKSGSGFVYRIDQQGSQISEDGKVVSVPYHSSFKVFDRHFSLTFTPMLDKQGSTTLKFGILFKKDFRSMGASVTTNSACLVSVPEPTGTMARTTQTTKERCLYGLQLLPLAPQDSLTK